MFDFNDPNILVQMCKFQAYIEKAHIVIKFPCSYFVEWKTINNRYTVSTQHRIRTSNDEAIFNQKLTFYTEMVYNTKKKQYYSKQTFLVLNLVSKSRPDQVKLVGRVSVDLADVLNRKRFSEIKQVKLNYCSVEGSLVFSVNLLNRRDSNLSVKDLDRSAFTQLFMIKDRDYFSLNPINRMMIQQSINGSYNNGTSMPFGRMQQQQANKTYFQQQPSLNPVPSFAPVPKQLAYSKPPKQPSKPQKPISKPLRDQQIISFQNSQHQNHKQERQELGQSPRTQSRQQSLIEKLQQKNFGKGNVVEVNSREARTDRVNGSRVSGNNVNRSDSMTDNTSGNNVRLSKQTKTIVEQPQQGQIKKQSVLTKVSSQTKLPSVITSNTITNNNNSNNTNNNNNTPNNNTTSINNTITSKNPKPTSPPSRALTKQPSSSQFSSASQFHNQQLLSIVSKLQQQKLQQESMIQSLKALLVNKSMKKTGNRVEDNEEGGRVKECLQEISGLRQEVKVLKEENGRLTAMVEGKSQEIRQKELMVFELLDKIKKLQGSVAQLKMQNMALSSKLQLKEDSPQITNLKQQIIQYQSKCQLLQQQLQQHINNTTNHHKLQAINSKHLQPHPTTNNNRLQTQPISDSVYYQLSQTGQPYASQAPNTQTPNLPVSVSKSSKLLQSFKLTDLRQSSQQKQFQVQSLPQHEHEQQLKITITKDENIYQDMERQNLQLAQRVRELQEENSIYRDLLKEHNGGKGNVVDNHQIVQARQQVPVVQIQQQDSPIRITISKNLNIVENYQVLQQQNKQLCGRVIQLQQQIKSYKQLLRKENYQQSSSNNIVNNNNTNNNNSTNQQSSQPQPQFTITLSQNPNIYHNQQQQLQQLYQDLQRLQQQLSQYKRIYGELNKQPEYKVSVTREENIYEDQQREIRELGRLLQEKDQQVVQLIERISMLEGGDMREQRMGSSGGNDNRASRQDQGQIRITIKRDENIYQEQQRDIVQLRSIIQSLQGKILQYQSHIQQLTSQLVSKQQQIQHLQHSKPIRQLTSSQPCPSTTPLTKHLPVSITVAQQPSGSNNNITQVTPCIECPTLRHQISQLQLNLQLLQQQKGLLQEEIGNLQQEKFCLNSTENELRIKLEEMQEELSNYRLENERLVEEMYSREQQGLQGEEQYENYQEEGFEGMDSSRGVGNSGRFVGTVPQGARFINMTANNNNINNHPYNSTPTSATHLNQLVQSPSNQHLQSHHIPQSPSKPSIPSKQPLQQSPSKKSLQQSNSRKSLSSHKSPLNYLEESNQKGSHTIMILQEQNVELRQSLTRFQQQLQQQYLTIGQLQNRIARLMHDKQILVQKQRQMSQQLIVINQKLYQKQQQQKQQNNRIKQLQQTLTNKTNTIVQLQHKLQQLTSSQLQQDLIQKQQQVQHLQKQLHQLNYSLNQLSLSYQSLQETFSLVQKQKQQEIEEIRLQHQAVNRILKQQLQGIQAVINERQRRCEENEEELRARAQEIEGLCEEVERLKEEINVVREESSRLREEKDKLLGENVMVQGENSRLLQENNRLGQDNTRLVSENTKLLQENNTLTQQHNNPTTTPLPSIPPDHPLIHLLSQLHQAQQHRSQQLTHFLPIISTKLNHLTFQPHHTEIQQSLAKKVQKQLQKIKINVMRTNGMGAKTSGEFRSFAQKQAILQYLKPLEQLLKAYQH